MESNARPSAARLAVLVALALVGFAANSLLCRLALAGEGSIDPVSFTALRIGSGALILVALAGPRRARERGSMLGTLALFVYAIAFSLAYVRIGASVGALVLFAAVQITMLSSAIAKGDRPGPRTWIGLVAALAGIAWLVAPGLSAPDPIGALLMAGAGVAWGAYSLLGRRNGDDPLGTTAGNFSRALIPALVCVGVGLLVASPKLSLEGVLLAIGSGALASGLGYAIWYAALPWLDATRAGIVQLLVPILAAAAALPLLGEALSLRLVGAGIVVIGGVALALVRPPRG
ncbi:DMT family transporter [Nannocystaceae bacterium ST9]